MRTIWRLFGTFCAFFARRPCRASAHLRPPREKRIKMCAKIHQTTSCPQPLEPVPIGSVAVFADLFPHLLVKKPCRASAHLRLFSLICEKISRKSDYFALWEQVLKNERLTAKWAAQSRAAARVAARRRRRFHPDRRNKWVF